MQRASHCSALSRMILQQQPFKASAGSGEPKDKIAVV